VPAVQLTDPSFGNRRLKEPVHRMVDACQAGTSVVVRHPNLIELMAFQWVS
jgi:hypothetical protein